MASDPWSRLSRRRQSTIQSRFDTYLGFEDFEAEVEEDESSVEFACPFCLEEFDILELCYHVNEDHPVEAKNGVCPICGARIGMDLVDHITMQHGNFLKVQRRKRVHRGSSGSHSPLTYLRKELCDEHLGGYYMDAPSNAAPDPLLSSFITNVPAPNLSKDAQPDCLEEGDMVNTTLHEKAIESIEPVLSEKDQEERARRSEFVQGLVLSTIFDDSL